MRRSLILYYLLLYKPLGYILAFFGMIIGGDETVFITAFLARERFLELNLVLLVILVGVFWGDLFWYVLGTRLKEESFLGRWVIKLTQPFDEHLTNNSFRTIFISKFTYGFNHAVLIRAGMLKVNFRKFLFSNTLSILFWVAIVGGLGYFSSVSLHTLKHYLRYTEIALLSGLVGFALLESLARWMLKKGL